MQDYWVGGGNTFSGAALAAQGIDTSYSGSGGDYPPFVPEPSKTDFFPIPGIAPIQGGPMIPPQNQMLPPGWGPPPVSVVPVPGDLFIAPPFPGVKPPDFLPIEGIPGITNEAHDDAYGA